VPSPTPLAAAGSCPSSQSHCNTRYVSETSVVQTACLLPPPSKDPWGQAELGSLCRGDGLSLFAPIPIPSLGLGPAPARIRVSQLPATNSLEPRFKFTTRGLHHGAQGQWDVRDGQRCLSSYRIIRHMPQKEVCPGPRELGPTTRRYL